MGSTLVDARSAMFALLFAAWNTQTVAIVGTVPEIVFEGGEKVAKSQQGKYFARASVKTVISQQSTLSTFEGAQGKKIYTESGLFFLQVFSPKSDNAGLMNGLRLAQIARNAFRGTEADGGIWFRNARINELDPEQEFFRVNVIAEFEYREKY